MNRSHWGKSLAEGNAFELRSFEVRTLPVRHSKIPVATGKVIGTATKASISILIFNSSCWGKCSSVIDSLLR
jgi:hypothetical protein